MTSLSFLVDILLSTLRHIEGLMIIRPHRLTGAQNLFSCLRNPNGPYCTFARTDCMPHFVLDLDTVSQGSGLQLDRYKQ